MSPDFCAFWVLMCFVFLGSLTYLSVDSKPSLSNQYSHPTLSAIVLKSRKGNLVCIVCKVMVRNFWMKLGHFCVRRAYKLSLSYFGASVGYSTEKHFKKLNFSVCTQKDPTYNCLLDKILPSKHTPVSSFQINTCKYNLQFESLLLLSSHWFGFKD